MPERVILVTESEERDAGSPWRKGTDVREVETCRTGLSVVCSKVGVEFMFFLVFLDTETQANMNIIGFWYVTVCRYVPFRSDRCFHCQ